MASRLEESNKVKSSEKQLICDFELPYRFDPAKTALLAIDFQSDFLSPDGMCASRGQNFQNLRKILPQCSNVLSSARIAGITVIHTRECYRDDLSDVNPYRRYRDSIIGEKGPLGRFLICSENGSKIVPDMAPSDGELIVDKAGFNAFHDTNLDKELKSKGITHVIIIGITAQCCVSSTLRGAVDHGYFPLMLRDCVAAFDDKDLDASVRVIYSENHNFGWVSTGDKLLAALA